MRTIVEDLNYAAQEPSSEAAVQAKRMGLAYVGFGRYEDPKTNQVTHIVQNHKLVPFRKAVKTNEYRGQQADDIGSFINVLSPEVQEVNDLLNQAFPPQNYDETELNAIQEFTSGAYANINDMLATLPAGISAKKIQPTGPDDNSPAIIAALDSAIKKSRSPTDFIAYAKIDMDIAGNLAAGQAFKFKGFRSTSVNLANVLPPGEDQAMLLQINVRKNAHGLYTANYSQNPDELEFILPRGAKIEVLEGPTRLVGSDAQLGGKNKQITFFNCQTKS